MSGKKRKRSAGRSGNPRINSGSAPSRITLPKNADSSREVPATSASQTSTNSQAPIVPPPPKNYYTRCFEALGFQAFNPLYDGDEYYENLRRAFALEMKLMSVGYYPDPVIAEAAHDLFIERITSPLSDWIPVLAEEMHEGLQKFFIQQFLKHGKTIEDFHTWDRDRLNGFFAEKEFIDRSQLMNAIVYHDEITEGATSRFYNSSTSYTAGHPILFDEDRAAIQIYAGIVSTTVTKALQDGYTIDEIVEGLVRQTVAYELFNVAGMCAMRNITLDDEGMSTFSGLNIATSKENVDGSNVALGMASQGSFVSLLHIRSNPANSLSIPMGARLLEIVARRTPGLYEKLFEVAFIEDTDIEFPHLLIPDAIKAFVTKFYGQRDPELTERLHALADSSTLGFNEFAELSKVFITTVYTDPRFRNLVQDVEDLMAPHTRSSYTFLTPPASAPRVNRTAVEVYVGMGGLPNYLNRIDFSLHNRDLGR
ncbi:MAG TPA: hypothetical protein PKB15_06725 [Acidimicrobiia bacterium]|nr:hypothetical protein [Acidimicrobiia bacterium]